MPFAARLGEASHQAESDLFGFTVTGHPLELFKDIAWDTHCPVNRLAEFVGQTVQVCGLVVEQRIHNQVTGEPMKFLSLADWTGIVETELFSKPYRTYGLATVRYPLLEIEARVEPFENGRGFTLRAIAARKPRSATSISNYPLAQSFCSSVRAGQDGFCQCQQPPECSPAIRPQCRFLSAGSAGIQKKRGRGKKLSFQPP